MELQKQIETEIQLLRISLERTELADAKREVIRAHREILYPAGSPEYKAIQAQRYSAAYRIRQMREKIGRQMRIQKDLGFPISTPPYTSTAPLIYSPAEFSTEDILRMGL